MAIFCSQIFLVSNISTAQALDVIYDCTDESLLQTIPGNTNIWFYSGSQSAPISEDVQLTVDFTPNTNTSNSNVPRYIAGGISFNQSSPADNNTVIFNAGSGVFGLYGGVHRLGVS